MKRFQVFMEKSDPDRDRMSGLTTYGYSTAQLLVHVLGACGDDLTRENVMRHASSIRNFAGDLALPGMAISTSPTDYRVNKQFQMMRFSGEQWSCSGRFWRTM